MLPVPLILTAVAAIRSRNQPLKVQLAWGFPRTAIVRPTDTQVLDNVIGPDDKPKATITLTTCHPRYSARQRLIVFGNLSNASTNNSG